MSPMPPEPKPDPADRTEADPVEKPVDEKAQEEAGKVREESGGYD